LNTIEIVGSSTREIFPFLSYIVPSTKKTVMFYHKNLNSFSLKCLYTVVPPQGEAKSEFEIFQLLSLRLGLGDEMAGTPTKWLKKMASPILDKGVTFEELQNGPVEMVPAHEIPYADKCFKTESGLFEFITDFKDDNLEGSDEGVIDKNFPLHLLFTSTDKWVGSVLPESEIKNGYLEV